MPLKEAIEKAQAAYNYQNRRAQDKEYRERKKAKEV